MTPAEVARYVSGNVRIFGLRPALKDAVYLAARKVVDLRILLGMTAVLPDIDGALLHAAPLEARFATPAEVRAAARCDGWREQLPPPFVDAAFARGDECFALFDGSVMASIGWYARMPTPVTDGMTLHFDPGWVYMHRGYTLPAYRGRRLHGMGMSLALRAYTERGALGLISFVEFNNLQSLRSVARMGYRTFGEILLVNLGGSPRAWSSPGCRRYDFRLLPGGDLRPETGFRARAPREARWPPGR